MIMTTITDMDMFTGMATGMVTGMATVMVTDMVTGMITGMVTDMDTVMGTVMGFTEEKPTRPSPSEDLGMVMATTPDMVTKAKV